MSKKVLIISSSLRKDSNSEMLADEFMRGAKEAGHQAEKVSLRDRTIGFCKGCLACQMKTMLDRANPLFASDYAFRDIYLLTTAADSDEDAMSGAVKGLEGWIACFEKAKLAGAVFGGGVDAPGEAKEHPALEKAYQMGQNI